MVKILARLGLATGDGHVRTYGGKQDKRAVEAKEHERQLMLLEEAGVGMMKN